MEKRCISFCLLLLALLFSFAAPCTSAARVAEIRIADSKGDWGYPNAFRHYPRGPGYVRMSWVFDTLVWKDQKGYVPALAESWSYDPGRTAFTFNLNPKAKWHDGQPLRADDVVFTIEFFKKYSYPWITVDDVSRVEAQGAHKVVIYLSKPYSPFLSDIGGTMPVMPRHIWQSVENPQAYNEPKAFIGSGPYRFMDFNKAQGTYLYEAFEDYYQGRPKADRIIYVRAGQPMVSLSSRQVDLSNIQPDMAEPLRIQKQDKDKAAMQERVLGALKDVHLSTEPAFLGRYPHELNMGALQRVCIARALVSNPSMVVADEPTSSLDPSVQAKVLKMMLDLQIEKGLTMLFITHDLGLARKIGDRIGVMLAGRLVESGPAVRVMGRPAHPYTRLLIAGAKGEIEAATRGQGEADPEGCPFVVRCDRAQELCASRFPEMRRLEVGRHRVWCHFPLV